MDISSLSTEAGDELRRQGNDLYKQGHLEKALEIYRQAANAAPKDPAPRGNISAALLELGRYSEAIDACEEAISLYPTDCSPAKAASQEKIWQRKCKLCISTRRLDDAAAALKHLSPGPAAVDINAVLSTTHSNNTVVQDKPAFQAKLINAMPRMKPDLAPSAEFYTIGHDSPESLLDPAILKTSQIKYAVLFGGISDARHLFATLVGVANAIGKQGDQNKVVHFTMNDVQGATIARDMVVMCLLSRGANELLQSNSNLHRSEHLQCLFYTYLAPTMPKPLYNVLISEIKYLIKALKGEGDLPSFLDIQWLHPFYGKLPSQNVMSEAFTARCKDEMFQGQKSRLPRAYHKAADFFVRTSMLVMEQPWHDPHTDEFRQIYAAFDPKNPLQLSAADLDEVASKWAKNPTLFDCQQHNINDFGLIDVFTCNDPFDWYGKTSDRESGGLFASFLNWHQLVCKAMNTLEGRYRVEVCVGDVMQFMEQVRHDTLRHRQIKAVQERMGRGCTAEKDSENSLNNYPRVYDRVHLSNIPDYVGGNLPVLLYTPPVLRQGPDRFVTARVMRNPNRFDGVVAAMREYVCLGSLDQVEKAFHVRPGPRTEVPIPMPLQLLNQLDWHRVSSSHQLMGKSEMELWLFRLFWRLVLPVHREVLPPRKGEHVVNRGLILAPLNLTIFVKVLEHLHNLGYPSHWLAFVLESICTGKITTSARPAWTDPFGAKEYAKQKREIQQSTAPFVGELSSLLALWQPAMSLTLVSPHIPPVQTVHQYSHTFSNFTNARFKHDFADFPVFVLVIYKPDLMPGEFTLRSRPTNPKFTGRDFLGSDERCLRSTKDSTLREGGIHVVSTWQREGRKAVFWFRADWWEKMLGEGDWILNILRTDEYVLWPSEPAPLKVVKNLGSWVERSES